MQYNKDNPLRCFFAFEGYNSQGIALNRIKENYPDFDWMCVGRSEIDVNAIKAANAIFPESTDKNYGNIQEIDWKEVPDFDLLIMSSPCQDFSQAGRQAGGDEGSGTRSSLLWECRKAIIAKKPRYILFENVQAIISKKFIRGFNKWQAELESYGYTNFAKVLDSSKFGVPQHRERLFMISILDCTQPYYFPKPFKLEKRIKDILEPYGTVDESFYFSPEQLLRIIANCDKTRDSDIQVFGKVNNSQDGVIVTDDSISPCHCAGHGNVPKVAEQIKEGISIHPLNRKMEFQGFKSIKSDTEPCLTALDSKGEPVLWQRLSIYGNNAQAGRVYDVEGIAPTVKCYTGGNSEPKILEPCILGYTRDDNGKVCDRHDKDIANTVHTSTGNGGNTDQFVKEPISVAMRGRNPDNPSDRSNGCPTEQRLEFGDNIANCITTVQKDSMVAEPMVSDDPRKVFGEFRYSDVCSTLLGSDYKSPKLVREPIELSFDNLPDKTVLKDEDGKGYLWQDGSLWRVRRLTPVEVGRLMDCSDEDIQKMIDAGISKSKLYSLFGNSIVISVLYHIFRRLWIDTEDNSAQKSLFYL